MKRLSATSAALTAAVLAAAVALPAAASTGTSNGGASATTPPADASTQQARSADYQPVKATWYGPGLYGNQLACGGRLAHRTLGVAHKSLPCGTKVALRYHGHTVVVPVIDRGPYARGVSYDLTEATAKKLGMTETSRLAAAPLGRCARPPRNRVSRRGDIPPHEGVVWSPCLQPRSACWWWTSTRWYGRVFGGCSNAVLMGLR